MDSVISYPEGLLKIEISSTNYPFCTQCVIKRS